MLFALSSGTLNKTEISFTSRTEVERVHLVFNGDVSNIGAFDGLSEVVNGGDAHSGLFFIKTEDVAWCVNTETVQHQRHVKLQGRKRCSLVSVC